MAVTFPCRIEAKLVVPSGGAAVSAQVANGGSAATVTVPSAAYYLTSAGGIPGLIATLQTQLNTKHELMGFPRASSVMDAVVGGDWTNGSGWLCQEASGNLAPVFGAVTLTASGTPTYRNDGIKDGDYAVGFSTNATSLSGGDVFDVTATDDMVWAWVANFGANVLANFISKGLAGGGGTDGRLVVYTTGSNTIEFAAHRSSDGAPLANATCGDATLFADVWHVGIAVIDRSTGKLRVGIQKLAAGTQYISNEESIAAADTSSTESFVVGVQNVATAPNLKLSALYAVSGPGVATGLSAGLSTALTNFANAINSQWSVSLSDTTGQVTIDWTGYETPTHSLTWTSTDLRDVLGFDANISNATSATTGAKQSPACWLPDAPLNVDGHPAMTPEETDLRVTESPTGVTLGLAGNTKYVHTNVRYRRVPVDRIREASASVGNASLEVFLRNTQFGQGDLTWFTPASPVQIYWNNAGTLTLLGGDANSGVGVAGWTIVGISSFSQAVRLSQDGYTGHFDVTFPRLVSAG